MDSLRTDVVEAGAEALLVTSPANVRYLSGFTSPEDGRVLLTQDAAWLLTDGRYTVQAAEESKLEVDITNTYQKTWQERLIELSNGARLAIEADHLSVASFRQLEEKLGYSPVATDRLLQPYRLIKSSAEVELLREAAEITDRAFEHILGFVRPGITEIEVALELERFMVTTGADAKAFGIIVASGPRGAMPHGLASQRPLALGEFITLDFGAVVGGYHADMTRTVALGEVSSELMAVYDAVLEAQEAALAALGPGESGRAIDQLARDILDRYQLASYFSHSLGHGVGLEIHERPSLSQRVDDRLETGMSVTIEPGVYLPGKGGVRIEDLAVITESGYERLSSSPKGYLQI
ncbi:MAG: aminopeptidase P family protein [Trueperaceae bacterium]|nr:MAG: aminopeptidase P family protein [Trueperaceae bacterium]